MGVTLFDKTYKMHQDETCLAADTPPEESLASDRAVASLLSTWKSRLLAIGRRSRFISYRHDTRSSLTIAEPDFYTLFARALAGEALAFRPVCEETDKQEHALMQFFGDAGLPLGKNEGDLATRTPFAERAKTLKNISEQARLSEDEHGVGALFLFFGFLEWESAAREPLSSPVLLLPVRFSQERGTSWAVRRTGEALEANASLARKLRVENSLDMPAFSGEPEAFPAYLKEASAFAESSGWRIDARASLGIAHFQKSALLEDLEESEAEAASHPVIRAFAGARPMLRGAAAVPSMPPAAQRFSPFIYDSSQMQAIELSRAGVSFVLQGPPGTGKSQTIANIICQAFADGKSVLFVSQKAAALEAVAKRLRQAGMQSHFLLAHSHNATKSEIYGSLNAALESPAVRLLPGWEKRLEELERAEREIAGFEAALSERRWPLSETIASAIRRSVCEFSGAKPLDYRIEGVLALTDARLAEMHEAAERLGQALSALKPDCPWKGMDLARMGAQEAKAAYLAVSEQLKESLPEASRFIEWANGRFGLSLEMDASGISRLLDFLEALASAPLFPFPWHDKALRDSLLCHCEEAAVREKSVLESEARLAPYFQEGFESWDFPQAHEKAAKAIKALRMSPMFADKTAGALFVSAEAARARLSSLLYGAAKLKASFDASEASFPSGFGDSLDSARKLARLFGDASSAYIPNDEWLAKGEARPKRLAEDAQEASARLSRIQAELAGEWLPECLALDAKGMLERFRTRYQSSFRSFLPSFRFDRKSIMGVSRHPKKGFHEDKALEMLDKVREAQEASGWLDLHSKELESSLGPAYRGLGTNWGKMRDSLAFCHSVAEAFPHQSQAELFSRIGGDKARASLEEAARGMDSALAREGMPEGLMALREGYSSALTSLEAECLPQLKRLLRAAARLAQAKAEFEPLLRKPMEEESFGLLSSAAEAKRERGRLFELAHTFPGLYGARMEGPEGEWGSLAEDLRAVGKLMGFFAERASSEQAAQSLSSDINARFEAAGALEKARAAWGKASKALCLLESWQGAAGALFGETLALLSELDKRAGEAEDWAECAIAAKHAEDAGLKGLMECVQPSGLDSLGGAFLSCLYRQWAQEAAAQCPELAPIAEMGIAQAMAQLAELEEESLAISRARVLAKLSASIPDRVRPFEADDELSLLLKELAKTRGRMAPRKLFSQIPRLALSIKPCMMMSPVSVARLLSRSEYKFDMAIFDEASQILPEDAAGAILRAQCAIVCGDSKQLPPTSFFGAAEGEHGAGESLLEAAARSLPSLQLKWHYRSRHESLIAFSNESFYGNSLRTFPSPDPSGPLRGVSLVFCPDGVYEPLPKNRNLAESRKCAELVFEHFRNKPGKSLGVIAFSQRQQQAIASEVEKMRREAPEMDCFFSGEGVEPFFVKNLENVQGDERDNIILSICYARTESQKKADRPMHMRFGPLGARGGERRLNVAATRAREAVYVVSSIHSSDIDFERAASEGARALAGFLAHAEQAEPSSRLESGSPFGLHAAVQKALSDNGFASSALNGFAGAFADLAVRDPSDPRRFFLAVGCTVESGAGARERFYLEPKVLRGLGWKTAFASPLAWMQSPHSELMRLLDGEGGNAPPPEPAEWAVLSERKAEAAELADGFDWYDEAWWFEAPEGGTKSQIAYVVSVEEPIHIELLYERMAGAMNRQRITAPVKNAVDREVDTGPYQRVGGFVSFAGHKALKARIPRKGEAVRPIEHIPPEELAIALRCVSGKTYGIAPERLFEAALKLLGFSRPSARQRDAMRALWEKEGKK
jgi:hypothetical protein